MEQSPTVSKLYLPIYVRRFVNSSKSYQISNISPWSVIGLSQCDPRVLTPTSSFTVFADHSFFSEKMQEPSYYSLLHIC